MGDSGSAIEKLWVEVSWVLVPLLGWTGLWLNGCWHLSLSSPGDVSEHTWHF